MTAESTSFWIRVSVFGRLFAISSGDQISQKYHARINTGINMSQYLTSNRHSLVTLLITIGSWRRLRALAPFHALI